MSPPRIVYQAKLVFAVNQKPLRDGWVAVDKSRICAVGSGPPPAAKESVDLGNCALLPGLVNAHTHLEFSLLERQLGAPGISLPEWIRLVIHWRRTERTLITDSVAAGLAESARSGTAAVGEIATIGFTPEPWRAAGLDCTLFRELIGFLPDSTGGRLAVARDFIQRVARSGAGRPGISPHAPYTVHPELLRGCVRLATELNVPLAMHLAESPEELELLEHGTGQFQALLAELGLWREDVLPRNLRPLDYLRQLSAAPRVVVIHGNYLDEEEVDFLARHAATMGVVYCPRTHAYFGHRPHPLPHLLARGARVALGTDGRASNPDLSLWEEMRFLAELDIVPLHTVLELGTLGGAHALGLGDELGTLAPGKAARLCTVALPEHDDGEPYEVLFAATAGTRPVALPPHH